MVIYSKRCFSCFLWSIIILSYIIAGAEFSMRAFAGTAIWDISFTYIKQFSGPIPRILKMPYKIYIVASGRIEVISPEKVSSVVNISSIESSGFSQIFALNEVGEYQIEESYVLTISSPTFVESRVFAYKDVWSFYNSTSALVEFRLEDMYIDNYTYNALPSDFLKILSIAPSVNRPGDTFEITISTSRAIKEGETVPISITINADWHKISSIATSSTQGTIQLKSGWNLVSFPVSKCFYEGTPPVDQPECIELVNVKNLGFNTLAEWFDSVLKPDNAWHIVIGKNGAMDNSLPHELHSLDYISPCSGYWVKIKEEVSDVTLSISGQIFDLECGIPLLEGWNLVGYPVTLGYYDTMHPDIPWVKEWLKVEPPVMATILKGITGMYSLVLGEHGAYNPNFPTEFSSLHYIAPGLAYWVKMNEARDLIYPSGKVGGTASFTSVRH